MAIAHVGDATVDGSHASPGPALSYTSTGGNTLVLSGAVYTGTTSIPGITAINDSASNSWTFATSNGQFPPSHTGTDGTNFYVVFAGYALNANAITSVTVTDSTGNSDFWHVIISEWSGVNSADTGASASGTAANPSLSLTAGNAGDVVIGVMDTSTGSPSSRPVGSTAFGTDNSDFDCYQFPGATGSFSFTWPMSSADYAIAMLALSPASPAPPAAPSVLYSMRMMP